MACYKFELKRGWQQRYLPAQTATTLSGETIDISHCRTLNSVVRTVYAFLKMIPVKQCPVMGNSPCRVIDNMLHVKLGPTLIRVNTDLLPWDTYEEWLSHRVVRPDNHRAAFPKCYPGVQVSQYML